MERLSWFELAYRCCIYVVDLDDGSGQRDWRKSSLSATKLCGYLAVFVGLLVILLNRRTTSTDVLLVVAGVSALFGRSMWKTWLLRNQWTTSTSEQRVETHEVKEIVERRANSDHEATP